MCDKRYNSYDYQQYHTLEAVKVNYLTSLLIFGMMDHPVVLDPQHLKGHIMILTKADIIEAAQTELDFDHDMIRVRVVEKAPSPANNATIKGGTQ